MGISLRGFGLSSRLLGPGFEDWEPSFEEWEAGFEDSERPALEGAKTEPGGSQVSENIGHLKPRNDKSIS